MTGGGQVRFLGGECSFVVWVGIVLFGSLFFFFFSRGGVGLVFPEFGVTVVRA